MEMEEEESFEHSMEMTRKALYDLLRECPNKKIDDKFKFVETRLQNRTKCPDSELVNLRQALKDFKCGFKKRWTAACNKHERFLTKNEQWLSSSVKLPTWSGDKPGRPIKEFEQASDRSKRRKTKDLREQVPAEELTYAARMSQHASGKTDVAKIIKDITASPTRATKIRKELISARKALTIKKHTPSEALSIFVEGDFTKRQWQLLHGTNKSIYPCYELIRRAKEECYPKAIQVTETIAEINLQNLLDHTSSRLCLYLEDVLEKFTEESNKNLELITKWGCDGSQQAQFKQKFLNNTDSDANIFQSSLVPLRLQMITDEQKQVIWQNPVPSSPRYCRPIRIRFIHETKDVTNTEIDYVEDQARNLENTEIKTARGTFHIKHTLLSTMVDAKICNAATNTSSTMRCYICGLTSKDFNDLTKKKEENPESLRFGLSILHARIRFFESLLHLSYKLPIKKWQARSSEEKQIVKERKEIMQKKFREEMGLLVDIPKAGFGNTNDGNTSRRFFADPDTASRITGIDKSLIQKFKVILEAISSGHQIDLGKFSSFTKETAKLYVQLYSWHPMSPTIHKILMHGATVIAHFLLPIGHLSEEAAEARNKHFRLYRQNFARKHSRVMCNRDILNRLLLSSDPLLSSIRSRPPKSRKSFSSETLTLLMPEKQGSSQSEGDDEIDKDETDVEL